ncbi:TIM barrel protein [Roseobacter ponti]|uniref:TIM barrel protein n=1 Tax=Roseobacter ponti TaxID=1891787 RepID=A0A858SSE0_9RHOB|nr:TIM barrel protein [Roseobacter ponti]QJF49826.1 TIM barrel protein [Roseobacter ponti]
MVKLAADLSMLWTGLPWAERFEAAAVAGFTGVVVPFPYDNPAKDTQMALLRNGLTLVMIATPPPNYTGGARGFAAVPGAEDRFAHDLRRALRYCEALRVPALRVLAGDAIGSDAAGTLRRNLNKAVDQSPANITLLVGPEPGADAFLQTRSQVAQLVSGAGTPVLRMDWPLDGAAPGWQDDLRAHAALVSHITLTAPPQEKSPAGGFSAAALEQILEEIGYTGWVTAGYQPRGAVEKTHGWMARLL